MTDTSMLPAESAQTAPTGEDGNSNDQAVAPFMLEHKGEKFEVPDAYIVDGKFNEGAAWKAFTDTKAELDKAVNSRAPETYEIAIPDDFKDRITNDNPMIQAATAFGKELNWSQDNFNQNVEAFLKADKQIHDAQHAAELEAMNGLYGDKTEETITAVDQWAKSATLSNEKIPSEEREAMYQALRAVGSSAAGVRVLDRIRSGDLSDHITENRIPGAGGSGGGEELTEAGLIEKKKDPRYGKDVAYTESVKAGFKKLYPN